MTALPLLNRFEGRVAVVTGAAQGIGAAIAGRLASEGATVACLDIDENGVGDSVEEILQSGATASAHVCDVRRRRDVEKTISSVHARYGAIDILISNAGIARISLIGDLLDAEWDQVLDTQLRGGFLCAQVAQRYMVPKRYGKIVFLSSVASRRDQVSSAAADSGLQGLTRTLAMELGRFDINVNAVAAGYITTPMTQGKGDQAIQVYEDAVAAEISLNALDRVGTPDDVSNLAAFLSSDESSYITGQIIQIAGRPTV